MIVSRILCLNSIKIQATFRMFVLKRADATLYVGIIELPEKT